MSDVQDIGEWDPDDCTLADHTFAGSCAGMAEHLVMFPVDTIKTRLQARPACSSACETSVLHCMRRLMREGPCAPWKGSGTVLVGCIPAHAAYFSIYESLKPRFGVALGQRDHPLGSSAAVAVAAVAHDAIMTPMDVMKQRLQLGFHSGVSDCARHIWRTEGARGFYCSFGVTLAMNVPYAAVMGGTNELLRHALRESGVSETSTYVLAGAGAGAVAGIITNPLDVVKTRLQTQSCVDALPAAPAAAGTSGLATARRATAGYAACVPAPLALMPARPIGLSNTAVRYLPTAASASIAAAAPQLLYTNPVQAAGRIWAEEGWTAFVRGIGPRALYHAPSVAISWTVYETVKHTLGRMRHARSE
ncbi:mitochondrial carrier domain-containing protein [Pavlovales sp. CCMP2436]|nr:mitochondrial carrier domain-containing protein [Pavlovales sp. CCMP2436]